MAIIGINGYAKSGKDTAGKLIQCFTTSSFNKFDLNRIFEEEDINLSKELKLSFEIKKFAYKLKLVASIILGVPVKMFEDQAFKDSELPECWDLWAYKPINSGTAVEPKFNKEVFRRKMTVREFLQKLGTEGLRNGLHENIWVNALMADYFCKDCGWLEEQSSADSCSGKHALPNWVITDTRFPNEAQAIKDKGGIVIRIDRPGTEPTNAHESETALDNWEFDYRIKNEDSFGLILQVQTILQKQKMI